MNLLRSEPSRALGGPRAFAAVLRAGWGILSAALVSLSAFQAEPAAAQSITQSEIYGSAVLANGTPLNGAFVILTSLSTGLVSESTTLFNGTFHFPNLPAGEYAVRVEALAYHPSVMTGIELGSREAVNVALSLRPAPPLVTQVDSIASSPTNTTLRTLESMSSVGGPIFARMPRINADIGESAALFTRMDPFFGGSGLPGSESILFADGIPLVPLRHPVQRGIAYQSFGLPLSALGSVELLGGGRDVEWTGGGGNLLAVSTNRLSLSPGTAFLSIGDPGIASDMAPEESEGSHLSIRGGGATSLTLEGERARLVLAGEVVRNRAWRDPSLPSHLTEELGNPGGLTGDQLDILGSPALDEFNAFSGLARLDWQASDAMRMGVRISAGRHEWLSAALPGGGLAYGSLLPGSGSEFSVAADATWQISPRYEMETRIGVGTASLEAPGTLAESTGLDNLPSAYLLSDGVRLGLQPGMHGSTSRMEIFASPVLHYRADGYRLKFGVALRHSSFEQDHLDGSAGSFFYSSGSDFRQRSGLFRRAVAGDTEDSFATSEAGAFAQYLWSPTPSLEITAGLRVDAESLPVDETETGDGGWESLSGMERIPGQGSVRKLGGTVGIQWTASEDGSTALGATLTVRNGRLDPAVFGEYRTLDGEVKVYHQAGQLTSPGSGPTEDLPRRLALLGPEFAAPRTLAAVVEGSRQLSPGTRIAISATYRRTDFLVRRTDLNRLPGAVAETAYDQPIYGELAKLGSIVYAVPGSNRRFSEFDFVWALNSDGWSSYRGATITVEHDAGSGFQLLSSYTLSRTRDNWFGASSLHPEASLVPTASPTGEDATPWEEGLSDFDTPHRATVGLSWVPGFFSRIRLTPVYRFSSGRPFTPMVRPGTDINGDGSMYNDVAAVPNRQDLGNLASEWSCLESQAGRFASRNSCREPSTHEVDIAVEVDVMRLGDSTLSLAIEGINLTDSRSGLRDTSLLVATPESPIAVNGTTVTIPLTVNPNFGDLLVPTNSGRALRATVRIR